MTLGADPVSEESVLLQSRGLEALLEPGGVAVASGG